MGKGRKQGSREDYSTGKGREQAGREEYSTGKGREQTCGEEYCIAREEAGTSNQGTSLENRKNRKQR
jgi:hypothetical protein